MFQRLGQGRKINTRPVWQRGAWLLAGAAALLVAAKGVVGPPPAAGGGRALDKPRVVEATVDAIERGQRATGLTFDAGNPVAASVRSGDRIDVTAAFAAGPDGQPLARTVLNHVLVIAAARMGANVALTLALDPADAERLAFAAANARLSPALCPDGPDLSRPTSGVTFDDL